MIPCIVPSCGVTARPSGAHLHCRYFSCQENSAMLTPWLYYRSWSASSHTHASSAPSLLLELSVDRLARAERTRKLQNRTVSFPDFSQYTSLHSAAGNAIDLPYMISCLCPLSSTALLPNNRPSRFSGSLSLRRVRRIW